MYMKRESSMAKYTISCKSVHAVTTSTIGIKARVYLAGLHDQEKEAVHRLPRSCKFEHAEEAEGA